MGLSNFMECNNAGESYQSFGFFCSEPSSLEAVVAKHRIGIHFFIEMYFDNPEYKGPILTFHIKHF